MLQITRDEAFIRVTADSPTKVRLKCRGGHFLPERAGRMVGGTHGTWTIQVPPELEARVQGYDGTAWADEAG